MTIEVSLIKKWEGLRTIAYICPAGVPTIGYGTTKYPNGVKVKLGDKCTIPQAEEYLQHDVSKVVKDILSNTKVALTSNQLSALCSFVYNLGIGSYKSSTLLKKLNKGNYIDAAQEFLKWNKAKDPKSGKLKALEGLTNRRIEERALFLTKE